MWNLGRIWIRFFTPHWINIRKTHQEDIDRLIENKVPSREIQQAIMNLLHRDSNKRISFEDFLALEPLQEEEDISKILDGTAKEEQTNSSFSATRQLYSSLMLHLKNNYSSNSRGSNLGSRTEVLPASPFTRELYYRYFR